MKTWKQVLRKYKRRFAIAKWKLESKFWGNISVVLQLPNENFNSRLEIKFWGKVKYFKAQVLLRFHILFSLLLVCKKKFSSHFILLSSLSIYKKKILKSFYLNFDWSTVMIVNKCFFKLWVWAFFFKSYVGFSVKF